MLFYNIYYFHYFTEFSWFVVSSSFQNSQTLGQFFEPLYEALECLLYKPMVFFKAIIFPLLDVSGLDGSISMDIGDWSSHYLVCFREGAHSRRPRLSCPYLPKSKCRRSSNFLACTSIPCTTRTSLCHQSSTVLPWKRACCMMRLQSHMQQPRDGETGWGKISLLLCTVHVV